MATGKGFGIEIGMHTGPAAARHPRAAPVAALPVLVLAPFGGDAVAPLAGRRPARVDLDRLDALLASMAPRLVIDGEPLVFRDLDDFRPEALLAQRPGLRVAAEAAAVVPSAASPMPADEAGLLASLLGGAPLPAAAAIAPAAGPTPTAPADAAIEQWLRGLIGAIASPASPAADTPMAAALRDMPTALRLLGLLRSERFRALESAWLTLARLLGRVEVEATRGLHLLPATPAELLQDLVRSGGRAMDTALARALDPGEAPPWRWVVVSRCFGATAPDLAVLAELASIGRARGFVVLADADIATALVEPEAWRPLREAGLGAHLALTLPRPRLRRPYGARTDPVDGLVLEEQHEHEADDGPWGSAAMMVLEGLLRGETGAFQADDLLLGAPPADEEAPPRGGLERRLDDGTAMHLARAGLMPWVAHRDGLLARLAAPQVLDGRPLEPSR